MLTCYLGRNILSFFLVFSVLNLLDFSSDRFIVCLFQEESQGTANYAKNKEKYHQIYFCSLQRSENNRAERRCDCPSTVDCTNSNTDDSSREKLNDIHQEENELRGNGEPEEENDHKFDNTLKAEIAILWLSNDRKNERADHCDNEKPEPS